MYIPTKKQVADLERLLEADGLIPPRKTVSSVPATSNSIAPRKTSRPAPLRNRVAILVDCPNASKSAKVFGDLARPDYAEVRALVSQYGHITLALAFVNPGYKGSCSWATKAGYKMVKGTDHDVDHLVVSKATEALASGVQTLVVVSGDHRFRNLQNLCNRLNVRYVAVGVPRCTNRELMRAGTFHALPVLQPNLRIAA